MSNKRASPFADDAGVSANEPPTVAAPRASTKSTKKREPKPMPPSWINLIEGMCADGDFEAGLASFEQLISYYNIPHPSLIQQLLALALSPSSCITSSGPTLLSVKSSRSTALSHDPLTPSHSKLRHYALSLLASLASANSARQLANGLPSHVEHSDLYPRPPSLALDKMTPDTYVVDEDDTLLTIAGKKIARECHDLWDYLGGKGIIEREEEQRRKKREKRGEQDQRSEEPISDEAWEVLSVVVGVWREEASLRAKQGLEQISPAFLRQFPPGVKSLNGKLMDIIFWPFQSSHGIQGDTNLDAEEGMMSLGEKRRVVGHLIELIAHSAITSPPLLDLSDIVSQLTLRLRSLSSSRAFISFLEEAIPITEVPSRFVLALAARYLESTSAPLNLVKDDRLLSPMKNNEAGTVPIPTASPSRLFGKSSSFIIANNASQKISSSSSRSTNQEREKYHELITGLLKRVPTEVDSFTSSTTAAASSRKKQAGRSKGKGKGKGKAGQEMVKRSIRNHRAIKLLLIDSLLSSSSSIALPTPPTASSSSSAAIVTQPTMKTLEEERIADLKDYLIDQGKARKIMESVDEAYDDAGIDMNLDEDEDEEEQEEEPEEDEEEEEEEEDGEDEDYQH